jgi:hypothetical protein
MVQSSAGVRSGQTVLSSFALAALGAVVAVVGVNLAQTVRAQPSVEAGSDSSMLTDILRKTVIIQYRRDALGLVGQTAPGWAETREGAISVQGDVIAVRPGWIGIRGVESRGERRDIWVPTHAILSIISR